jgi:dihydrofolate synthase/folylpolyglutamate synthase
VDWPGRLEWLRVGVDQFALIDAAHNPEGAAALAAYLGNAALGKLPIVIGIMQDKNADAMVRALAPAVSTFVVTEAATARSMPAAALGRLIAGLLPTPVVERADAIAAVAAALSISPAIVVAGSILLAGPVRATLIARGAEAVPFPSAS